MSRRPSRLIRVVTTAFDGLIRLLPGSFREPYLREAKRDLEEFLRERYERDGTRGVVGSGTLALLDVLRRIPSEWWRVISGHAGRRATERGRGMEEVVMRWTTDLRLAVRALVRRPGYAIPAVLTLGLGIGGGAAIFTIVNAVLLRPLPFPDAHRLVSIRHHAPGLGLPELENSEGMLNLYWQEADYFQSLAAYDTQERNLVGGPQPERVEIVSTSPELFETLGVQPFMGRPFNGADAAEGATAVVILTHATWVGRFGSSADVLGRMVELDGVPTEIVGVMPEGFAFPDPDAPDAHTATCRSRRTLGRLRPRLGRPPGSRRHVGAGGSAESRTSAPRTGVLPHSG